jgi:hypothetical protein
VRLNVRVETLRDDAARAIVADPEQLRGLGDDVQSDLRSGMVSLVLRTVLVTAVGALVLGLLVFRLRWRRVLASTGAGVGALLVTAGVSVATFEESSLAEPEFTGLLASAPAAVGDVRDLVARFDVYQLQLGRLVSNLSELYAVTSRLPVFTPDDDTIRVLHVSDLHLSPSAFDVIGSVAQQFQVDVVLDSGDLTDFGSTPEDRYVGEISSLGVPYVYVRGNHDSRATQAAVAAQEGAVVLDGPEVVEVAGVRFLGSATPGSPRTRAPATTTCPRTSCWRSAARWRAPWSGRPSRPTSSSCTTPSRAGRCTARRGSCCPGTRTSARTSRRTARCTSCRAPPAAPACARSRARSRRRSPSPCSTWTPTPATCRPTTT